MANWGNVKIDKNMKIISHERVEDTEPETYRQRGELFSKQGKFLEAETEYLKAVKFSGKDDKYIELLLRFYYSTKRKDFEKKADKIYPDWWRRQGERRFISYIITAGMCFVVGYGGLFAVFSIFPLCYAAGYWCINHRKMFRDLSRGKLRGSTQFSLLMAVIINGIWAVAWTLIFYSNDSFKRIDSWASAPLFRLLNGIVSIGGAVGCVIFFNKAITVLQNGIKKRKWKKYSWKVFWTRVLICVRLIGTPFLIGLTYVLHTELAQ